MAIARLSTGEVYTKYSDINGLVTPVQVGRFSFPESFEEKVNELEKLLTREGADYILSNLDPNAETIMKDAGFRFAMKAPMEPCALIFRPRTIS